MTSLPKLYYISQGESPDIHLNGIVKACQAGCKIVQLRLKNLSAKVVEDAAIKAAEICLKYNTTLVINDHLEVAKKGIVNAVHLGKNDETVASAKVSLPNSLIGGTANTLSDCIRLHNEGADYIGLGPYKYTNTKSNLDPVLGIDSYKDILTKLKSLKIETPVYAIGGITLNDIPHLLKLGLHGVAISSLFAKSTETEIKNMINQYG